MSPPARPLPLRALQRLLTHGGRLLGPQYPLRKRYEAARFRHRHPDADVVLVHQMGKVGSTAVVAALAEAGVRGVFHTHYLNPASLRFIDGVYRHASRVSGRFLLDEHLLASGHLLRRLQRAEDGRRWRIVSLVRDPVARNVSAFFQAFHLYFPEYGSRFRAEPANVEQLIRLFLERFDFENTLPLRWFDSEMRDVFGIDVYAQPFAVAHGYDRYAGERADLLVVRLEDLPRSEAAIAGFLGLTGFRLKRANSADDKRYQAAYHAFRDQLRLPESYLDRLYTSRFARHFWTDAERAAQRARWATATPPLSASATGSPHEPA